MIDNIGRRFGRLGRLYSWVQFHFGNPIGSRGHTPGSAANNPIRQGSKSKGEPVCQYVPTGKDTPQQQDAGQREAERVQPGPVEKLGQLGN